MGVTLLPVTFRYPAPTSGPVALVGPFNGWDPRAHLLKHADGGWSITIFLPPGTYPYAFAIEGRRTRDPMGRAGHNDLGSEYSFVIVPDNQHGNRAA